MGARSNNQANINNLTRPYAHYRKFAVSVGVFFLSFFIAGTFSPVLPSSALTCTDGSVSDPGSTSVSVGDICNTSGTSVTVNIENPAYLTISSSAGGSGGISLDYTKEGSPNLGNLITASDTVTTTSNTGQTKYLYISTSFNSSTTESNRLTNSNTDLNNDRTYLAAGGGDTLASAASLSDNTWGFSLTNPSSIAGSNTEIFTKVPTLNNELLISEDTGEFNDDTNDYISTQNIYYGAIATSDLYAGEYTNTIKYTAFTDEPVVTTHYMQDFTIEDCNNLKTSTATEDHRITLIDKRDNKPYKVSKLADGNCWMVENLALDGTDEKTGETRVLHPSDSNVTQNRTLATNISLGTPGNNTDVQIYSNAADRTDKLGNPYGNYYNFIAATAGAGLDSAAEVIYESVCPKGWQMPDNTFGYSAGYKSFGNLVYAYDLPTSNVQNAEDAYDANIIISTAPLRFSYAGRYYKDGSITNTDMYAYYWSRQSYDADQVRSLYFVIANRPSKSVFYPVDVNNKIMGLSVRCVFNE